jgi:hypothetical protein
VGGRITLPPVADEETGLVPRLPPIWTPGPALSALAASTDWSSLKAAGGAAGALGELYEIAAKFEAGEKVEIGPARPEPVGVRLVYDVVAARCGSADERAAARERLRVRIAPAGRKAATPPPWVEAWCRVALGRSLVREEAETERLLGVVELLHIPARFADEWPELAGLALGEAAVALAAAKDEAGASALKTELTTRFPRHPILEWGPLKRISGPGEAPAPPSSGSAQGKELHGSDHDGA